MSMGLFTLIGIGVAMKFSLAVSIPFFMISSLLLFWGEEIRMLWVVISGLLILTFLYFGVLEFMFELADVLKHGPSG
jgi:hypothetical protein